MISPTPTPTTTASASKVATVLRVTSGNFLEMFDFFLFGFYASHIAKAFFPTGDELSSLLFTFATFGAGFLMRPLGAIVLGAYVDRVGRRQGLIVTSSIMAIGTILVAFVPSYATIGLIAPILVLTGRLLQGFSAGVELGGVSVYLSEMAPRGQQGLLLSLAVGEPAGRHRGGGADRRRAQQSVDAGPDQRLGLARAVPHRLPDRSRPFSSSAVRCRKPRNSRRASIVRARAEIIRSMIDNWGIVLGGDGHGHHDDGVVLSDHRLHADFGKEVLKLSSIDRLRRHRVRRHCRTSSGCRSRARCRIASAVVRCCSRSRS